MTEHQVLVCLDKFRGSATAVQACRWLAGGIRQAAPGLRVREAPVADGGEGTVAAFRAAGYRTVPVPVSGPTGERVTAELAVLGNRAVVELAQAGGLHLLPGGRAEPLTASTYGTGELLRAALDLGCREVVLAVGGSASTDGGAGLLSALGARFLDAAGGELPPGGAALAELAAVDLTGLDPRLRATRLVLASDVDNPLLGPAGAAAVFGPQKGADANQVALLELALTRLAQVLAQQSGTDLSGRPGAGAAGGAGFAALVLGAHREAGVEVLLTELGLDTALAAAALVVVGEGCLDGQSLRGKAPIGVADRAHRAGVPVAAVAGRLEVSPAELAAHGIETAYSLTERAGSPRAAMAETRRLLHETGVELARRFG
ncbi:glycerate kinase [Streptomyces tateyamensis]|uniref:Glycerate kinase n=1 Tax=Streptomyces tateyamensis TaxID=565073 RepID=A0A2V4N8N4_9ACTN|nr:glycerate kinase [Streptomyces tateyamensis]PYC79565.1 glycerate kinase [Streptomyces tateyamensis]